MVTGVHALVFTTEPEALRAFFLDVLEWPFVDAHGGWLIFALPPAEIAAHPSEASVYRHELYLMCDDMEKTVTELAAKGVEFAGPIEDQGFGLVIAMKVPGGELGLYQPKHPTAI